MSEYVIAPPAIVAVPVVGGGAFPVRRIYCIGRNYADHAREMGHDPDKEPPFFFGKPADTLVTGGADMPYPSLTSDLHHEIELVVALGSGGRDLAPAAAEAAVFGYAAGIDMTRRDLQGEAKKLARPWDMAKGFDHSAPIGDIVPARVAGHPKQGAIRLTVNGELRQDGDLSQLLWAVPDAISYLSRFLEVRPGDLIFTGTPAGVGAVVRGDRLDGEIEGVGTVSVKIV
jgi:fumarylpyruvate hydrolase